MIRNLVFSGVAALVLLTGCSTLDPTPSSMEQSQAETRIRGVLAAQQAAWNSGDIPGFMDGYWQSDELRFASGGNITYGWQATLDRYLKSYDTPEAMGKLSFTNLDVKLLGPEDALVFGKWELERTSDKPWGLFTLHFRLVSDEWVVVSDHTSSGS